MERVENKRKVYNFRKLIVNIAGDMSMMRIMSATPARWISMRMRWHVFCRINFTTVRTTSSATSIGLCGNRCRQAMRPVYKAAAFAIKTKKEQEDFYHEQ